MAAIFFSDRFLIRAVVFRAEVVAVSLVGDCIMGSSRMGSSFISSGIVGVLARVGWMAANAGVERF